MKDVGSMDDQLLSQRLADILALTYACEIMAEACPALEREGAPPIQYVLEQANEKIRELKADLA